MSKKVVLGTHLRGGRPTPSLKRAFGFLSRIAKRAGLTDWGVLILEQPRSKCSFKERWDDKANWKNAADKLGGHVTLVYDFEYVLDEPTTLAWNKLHRNAFERLQADVFVYTDPNPPRWDKDSCDIITGNLAKLVKQATDADYVIGDYTPVIPKGTKHPTRKQKDAKFKITIEEGVKQMLSNRFPSFLAGWPLFMGLKRPRSEFHALSRKLYDSLKDSDLRLTPIPYDYGLQMLIVARIKGLEIRRVDIGVAPVIEKYSSQKMIQQLRRVDFQLAQIQDRLAASQSKRKKGYRFLHQTSILEGVFAAQNDLASLFELMRADYYDHEREDCVIWLAGRAWDKEPVLKIDHRFFLESDDIGTGFSIHPEDSIKAAIPAYHPRQTETIIVVDGDLVLECFTGEGEVTVKCFPKGSSVTIGPRECHRVARDPGQEKAYVFVKTVLGTDPDKVQCANCEIADTENCLLRKRWIEDEETLEHMGYKTEGHQPRRGTEVVKITNSKLLPTGRFKPFPGFSLLFDNPGKQNLSPMGDHFWRVDCKVHTDPYLGLYSKLRTSVEKIVLPALYPRLSFVELPACSYHVTVWDGLNEGNKEKVSERYQPDLANFLMGLPGTLRPSSKFTAPLESSPLVGDWPITFQFERLSVFGNSVLVARLKPVGKKSQHTYNEIKKLRRKLYKEFESEFGLDDWRSSYDPHISLGYFGNEQSCEAALSEKDHWTEKFIKEIGSESIHFNSISLYGFLDMKTYFKTSQEPS
jgi:hypothetical protein